MAINWTAYVEDILMQNKKAIKTYASYQFADAQGPKIEAKCQNTFDTNQSLDYIVIFLPTFKRFTTVFMFSDFVRRADVGGYIGVVSDQGFMSV